jgi:hypothetical protein
MSGSWPTEAEATGKQGTIDQVFAHTIRDRVDAAAKAWGFEIGSAPWCLYRAVAFDAAIKSADHAAEFCVGCRDQRAGGQGWSCPNHCGRCERRCRCSMQSACRTMFPKH